MYWRITSTGAPPAVSRQKLWLQKASFLLFLKLDCQWLFFDISLPWSDDNTLDILNAHYDLFFPCKSVLFLTIYVFDWLYYTTDCIVEQVFFFSIHLPPAEEGEFLLYYVKCFHFSVLSFSHWHVSSNWVLIWSSGNSLSAKPTLKLVFHLS